MFDEPKKLTNMRHICNIVFYLWIVLCVVGAVLAVTEKIEALRIVSTCIVPVILIHTALCIITEQMTKEFDQKIIESFKKKHHENEKK